MRQLPLFHGRGGAAAVYILQRRDRRRFKIGWAVSPWRRARNLPEFAAGELDLPASRVLWFPSRRRAEAVDGAVHKCLAPYAAQTGHMLDGYSEWFLPIAYPIALRTLSQMPQDDRIDRRARLAPLQSEAPPPDAVAFETGPQDAWWALEDLWTRLAMHCPIVVEREGGVYRVVIPGFRHACSGPVGALRGEVLDLDTYRWDQGGKHDHFVQILEYRGDDLVCELVNLRRIESWPGDLGWQVQGFLLRLQRMSAVTPLRPGSFEVISS